MGKSILCVIVCGVLTLTSGNAWAQMRPGTQNNALNIGNANTGTALQNRGVRLGNANAGASQISGWPGTLNLGPSVPGTISPPIAGLTSSSVAPGALPLEIIYPAVPAEPLTSVPYNAPSTEVITTPVFPGSPGAPITGTNNTGFGAGNVNPRPAAPGVYTGSVMTLPGAGFVFSGPASFGTLGAPGISTRGTPALGPLGGPTITGAIGVMNSPSFVVPVFVNPGAVGGASTAP